MKWAYMENHMHNYVFYHLLNVNGHIDPSLLIVPINCVLCGQSSKTTTMLVCDRW